MCAKMCDLDAETEGEGKGDDDKDEGDPCQDEGARSRPFGVSWKFKNLKFKSRN